MNWKEFLGSYWPEIAFGLGTIGFFIKRYFDKKDKLKYLNIDYRKSAFDRYVSAYHDLEIHLRNCTYDVIDQKLNQENVDKIRLISEQFRIALEQLARFETQTNMHIYYKIGSNIRKYNAELATYCGTDNYRLHIFDSPMLHELKTKLEEVVIKNGQLFSQIQL